MFRAAQAFKFIGSPFERNKNTQKRRRNNFHVTNTAAEILFVSRRQWQPNVCPKIFKRKRESFCTDFFHFSLPRMIKYKFVKSLSESFPSTGC